jgi:multidrug efflux system membrane fusion protein
MATYKRKISKFGYKNLRDRLNTKIFFGFVIISSLTLYLWIGPTIGKKNIISPAPINVSVDNVTIKDMPNNISLVGTVYAYETVAIKSRIDSQITDVYFKDGDEVNAGSLLFKLDDSVLLAALNQYEANLKRDQAQAENARTQYSRYQELVAKGFASKEKVEESKAAFKAQEATVNATKASIQSAKAQLDFTTIKAPISGRAGTINVTRGNNVKANDGNALVTINRVKPIRVQFSIPQRYYDSLREASKEVVNVTAQRSDGQILCTGRLEYIDNNIDTSTGSFIARAVFENTDEKLWPGMFVNVSITLNIDKNAMVIPQVAIQNGQDGSFVYILDSEGKKAIKTPVEIVRTQDNNAIIKKGLSAGDRVIVDGLLKISDGALVEFSTKDRDGSHKTKEH